MKILILVSSFFVLIMSKKYIQDINNNKFEYPVIMLIAILGMFFMVSSNDLILLSWLRTSVTVIIYTCIYR